MGLGWMCTAGMAPAFLSRFWLRQESKSLACLPVKVRSPSVQGVLLPRHSQVRKQSLDNQTFFIGTPKLGRVNSK